MVTMGLQQQPVLTFAQKGRNGEALNLSVGRLKNPNLNMRLINQNVVCSYSGKAEVKINIYL